ncbi:MAG: hypothetical protein U0Z75_07980 [Deinococcaceae bacterium]
MKKVFLSLLVVFGAVSALGSSALADDGDGPSPKICMKKPWICD